MLRHLLIGALLALPRTATGQETASDSLLAVADSMAAQLERDGRPIRDGGLIRPLFRLLRGAPPANDSLARVVQRRLGDFVLRDMPLWPRLGDGPNSEGPNPTYRGYRNLPLTIVVAVPDSGLAEEWRAFGRVVLEEAPAAADSLSRYHLHLEPPRRIGRFVLTRFSFVEHRAGGGRVRGGGFATGTELILLETKDGWRIVEAVGWIT